MPDDNRALGDRLPDIFKDVSHSISSSALRSLWERMREEMSRDDPHAAVMYLCDEIDRCRQVFAREMKVLEADYSQGGSS